MTALSIAVGIVSLYLGLVLTALPTILDLVELQGVALICKHAIEGLTVGGPAVGWSAAVLALLLSVSALRATLDARRASRRAFIDPWVGEHLERDEFELVILPTPALVAVGVPGPRPQILISQGLVSELDEARLDAVIRHEAAHHRLGHRRFLLLAAVADRTCGLLPPVGRSTDELRAAVEQWADEVAVEDAPEFAATLSGAINRVAAATAPSWTTTRASLVDVRSRRLTCDLPLSSGFARGFTYLPVAALAIAAMFLITEWAFASHHVFAIGGYCAS